MRLFKFSLLATTCTLLACSQLPTQKTSQATHKVVDPVVELGIKSDELKDMVAKAKSLGVRLPKFDPPI